MQYCAIEWREDSTGKEALIFRHLFHLTVKTSRNTSTIIAANSCIIDANDWDRLMMIKA